MSLRACKLRSWTKTRILGIIVFTSSGFKAALRRVQNLQPIGGPNFEALSYWILLCDVCFGSSLLPVKLSRGVEVLYKFNPLIFLALVHFSKIDLSL